MSCRILSLSGYKGLLLKPYLTLQGDHNYGKSHKKKGRLKLQKQPVPELHHTMKLYLESVKPFLTEREFSKTLALAKDFEAGVGRQLQEILLKRAATEENWLADWWQNGAYLEHRASVVIHSTVGLILPIVHIRNRNDQLVFAARILLASWRYKELADSHGIFQEVVHKTGLPLDMEPYNKIFGTCRIPCRHRDVLTFNTATSHFIIIHSGHVFHLDILGDDNLLLSEEQVIWQLQQIIKCSDSPNLKPVSILTTENRDTWAHAYQLLASNYYNRHLLEDVQNSLAVLCLDKCCGYEEALKDDDWRRTLAAHQVLHGGGTMCNSCNRWFDKSIQFIVGSDGCTGLAFEHSPADGQAVAGFAGYVLKYVSKYKDHTEEKSESYSPRVPWYMPFQICSVVSSMIDKAKYNMDKLVWSLEVNCFLYHNYGKAFMKSHKLSSDSYLQTAYQLAFYRLHKQPGAQYEAASVRIFAGGRTETIRSCTCESIEFAKVMLDKKKTCEEKVEALKKAIKAHHKYAVQASHGLGVDRHLFGLKQAAITNGLKLHELFTDIGFKQSFPTRLSTSRVFLKYGGYVVFGPVAPNGYAICYNPRDNEMIFALSAFKGSDTCVDDYRYALEQSLQDMKYILEHK